MKNCNLVEVIIFSKRSLNDVHQKELVRWLGRTAQTEIAVQNQKAKKIFLSILKDTPAIYMS